MLEREAELSQLAEAAREAAAGRGCLVLVSGEAGIGKSSLVHAVRHLMPAEGRLLVGHCDDLATPRTLGPLRDLIGAVGTDLTVALRDGDRESVLTALRAELDWAGHPSALIIEDVHWADEATLDVLRYLTRRIADLPAVLVLTYRDDELTRHHPLHQVLGQVSDAGRVRRLPLRRLSQDAVRQLGAAGPVDADRVFALTGGNPFFVAEVLAAGDGGGVPSTIVDAVLARVRRLEPATTSALEQLAVVPSRIERWLVDSLLPDGLAALAPAEERGLLVVSPTSVAFRHELARRAIVDAMPVGLQVELNRRVLDAVLDGDTPDLSRLVHHAVQAGDADAIVEYGPLAARDAAGAGAHREAAAHYRLALRYREQFEATDLADLLERHAIECYTIGAVEETLAAQQEAVAIRRRLGDPRPLGADLRWLSRMLWWAGDRPGAERTGTEAVAVLEPAGDRKLLGFALSNQSQLHMLAERMTECVAIGERAIEIGRELGDATILSHALTNVGAARSSLGDESGWSLMTESLEVALAAGDVEQACRAYVNTIWFQLDALRLDDAERTLAAGLGFAERADHLSYLSYLHVELGRLRLARADWDGAVEAAQRVLGGIPHQQCPALTVLGRVQVRRGGAEAADTLAQAWQVAVRLQELQRIGPVAAARAEAAWLAGDHEAVGEIAGPVHADASRLGHRQLQAELGFWLTRAGQTVPPVESEHPYALQAAGTGGVRRRRGRPRAARTNTRRRWPTVPIRGIGSRR